MATLKPPLCPGYLARMVTIVVSQGLVIAITFTAFDVEALEVEYHY